MDEKPSLPLSPNPQGAGSKSDDSRIPSLSVSASQDPVADTKQKRDRSPVRVPPTARMSFSHHVVVPRDGAIGFSWSGIGLPVESSAVAMRRIPWQSAASPESTDGTKPEIETGEASADYKSPTCTKPERKDGVNYYESLDNSIAASIKSIESSPQSKTFWETTGAIPKNFTKASTITPPKLPSPFRKRTPTKPKIHTELFPDVSDPVEESHERKSKEPPKNAPSSSTESKSSFRNLPKKRSDFKDNVDWVKFNCLDFQDYKRTVNNKQKGAENSINLLLPVMDSYMNDTQRLATKIAKVRSEVCDREETLRIQNDKLKYLVGRTMSTISKIDDILERFRADIMAYTTLTTEGNEGIDMRLSRLLMTLCGLSDYELSWERYSLIREAFSGEETQSD